MADEIEAVIVNQPNQTIVVTQDDEREIIVSGAQGPPGVADEDMARAKRTDIIDDSPSAGWTTIYIGEAQVGVLNADAAWRIRRVLIDDNADGDATIEWAENGGIATADEIFIWDNRLTYSYS